MKRIITLILALVFVIAFVGCTSGVSQEEYDALKQQVDKEKAKTPVPIKDTPMLSAAPTTQNVEIELDNTVTIMEFSYKPPLWRTVDAENGYYYYPYENNEDCILYVYYNSISQDGNSFSSSFWDDYIGGISPESIVDRTESETDSDIPLLRLSYTKDVNRTIYMMDSITFVTNDYLYSMMIGMPNAISDEIREAFELIISTVSIEKISNKVTPTQAPETESIGQRNALKQAKTYLSIMAFSYIGLVEQLEYEQFSHEDAVYAADNCGADWNEQAAKKAKDYLSLKAFSKDDLIYQLEFQGFTPEQAIYGAEANGY